VTLCAEALAYHMPDLQSRWTDYFSTTRLRVIQGALASSADFVQAQRVRRVAVKALARLLETVDVVVTPTASRGATPYDEETGGLVEAGGGLFQFVHTSYWDAVGTPALVMPMGFTADGLPLSLQMGGRPFDEATLITAGDAFQSVTEWHRQVPALVTSAVAA
jgi:aspartyl-tRNA(Asn)/glutamyl-tRNA(Gln) amidotransferase subunit A